MSADWQLDRIRDQLAAEAAYERAEADWEAAAARYRVEYHARQRAVYDEYGDTGAFEELTRTEELQLAQFEAIEQRTWAARQRAKAAYEAATRILDGGIG